MAMMEKLGSDSAPADRAAVDCGVDPAGSLVTMFVTMVQGGRIAKGQCPALRPVFLKPHGVAFGVFRIRRDLPEELRVGVFAGAEYPCWVRFSSDTVPTSGDFKTTCGIGIKLFNVPGNKLLGLPQETTFDFVLQNFDVFFVNTARDMCEFTKAGVVDGDYQPYLDAHPETAKLLDEMSQPVGSVLAIDYWSGVPFAFGPARFVKYKLEATISVSPPATPPIDPTYLAEDLVSRLRVSEARFRFGVQFQTDPAKMPLDEAMVPWSETESPPQWVAELILPQQDIQARGQALYGENLSYNIWRVTSAHEPQGSIAAVRKVVYAASAEQRRNVNGVPDGEPVNPRPLIELAAAMDRVIVRAAIHPAIGIARIGDSAHGYFIGPEVVDPSSLPPDSYRDETGALKRQAARFRIYGYNAAGDVVSELNPDSARIEWTVHLANRKSQWYQFQAALDVPEAKATKLTVPRRNAGVTGPDRQSLAIDPGTRSIAGRNVSGGDAHLFNTGTFMGTVVPLGEIRTDEQGRLLVLGGRGVSASPSNAPIYTPSDPNTFNNADNWYDDISDGPVTATVSIDGRSIPTEGAWVTVAPPNYAPDVIGWRTMYEMLVDVYIASGWLPAPATVSFSQDILPLLQRLNNLQWVNKGFATYFGKGSPLDFSDPKLIAKLARKPVQDQTDPYRELRRVIRNNFRANGTLDNTRSPWPWIYGDSFGSFQPNSPDQNLPLPSVQQTLLDRWVKGDFVNDWDPDLEPPRSLDKVSLQAQPAMLDRAALHFCLADAFHPGCEMTWPMRHATMYSKPFRIRHRPAGVSEQDYGPSLNQEIALQPGGPLYDQGPGDISRWMAIPWQGDTAFCRSGYEPSYDPYLPTFWPARVPNQVLTQDDYNTVMNAALPRAQRIAAFNNRATWTRALPADAVQAMLQMVARFQDMGIVEARPGIKDDPDFPEVIYVETLTAHQMQEMAKHAQTLAAKAQLVPVELQEAGWESEEHLRAWRRARRLQ
jgi:hypothetical protein